MKRFTIFVSAAMVVGVCASVGIAVPVEWSARLGGNGHFYEPVAVSGVISWGAANEAAIAAGGYLATITSEAENEFVFGLIDEPSYWYAAYNLRGPWIGGYQPEGSTEPEGGWSWVTGEEFGFANWDTGQPNEFDNNNENRIHFGNRAERCPYWNDVPEDFDEIRAYVVEYVPEPASLLLFGLGGLGFLKRTARR